MTVPYLTNERYKTMGFGIDLDGVEDVELYRHIVSASAGVNAYCAVPRLPSEHSFAGGTVIGEQHRWTLGTDTIHGTRRVYPYHRPIREALALRIRLTNQLSVGIGANDLFVNKSEGYVEVISLAAVTFGIFPVGIVPNLGLLVPVAELDYTYGYEFAVTGDPLFGTDGFTFQASHGYIDAASLTLYVDGTEVTTGFTIQAAEGAVVFDALQDTDSLVTADYTYTLPSEIESATGMIVADQLSERSLVSKGLGGLAGIRMAEIELRRSLRGTTVEQALSVSIPDAAQLLLEGYRFRSVA